MASTKRLYRSDDAVIAGVCAGIAERVDVDPVIVRILAVLVCVSTFGFALVAYVVLWLVLPKHVEVSPETIPCAAYDSPDQSAFQQPVVAPCKEGSVRSKTSMLSGWARSCVLMGCILLAAAALGTFGALVQNVDWWQFWPGILLFAGLVLMMLPSPEESRMRRFSVGVSLFAVGVLLSTMSLDLLSWNTLLSALSKLWPGFLIVIGLEIIGYALRNALFSLASAACVVALCVLALTVFAEPGTLHVIVIDGPFFESHTFNVNPWV